MKFIAETDQQKRHREAKLLDMLIESRKGIWDEKYSHVQINESEHGITSYWRFDSPSFVHQIFSREAFLERAKQLEAITELRLTEEQVKVLSEHMPQTGTLQILDDEPLRMTKRIEELEAQVRVMADLLRETTQIVPAIGVAINDLPVVDAFLDRIEAALAGNLPAQATPEGWQLVPVEPTPEMLAADGCKEHHEGQECTFHKNRRRIWAAMLAAAPKPEAE